MINCKNCSFEINEKDSFCKECGAQIIRDRITIKKLLSNLLVTLGWDSNFLITLRHLLYKPQIVFKEYINGTRKKYVDPFTFFAIAVAVSLFVISQYSEQLIKMSTKLGLQQTEMTDSALTDKIKEVGSGEIFGYKNQEEFTKSMMKFQIKYYNLISFLLLPLYTLIAFLVFRKPYNFGEHLVINTYLQSIITFLGVLLFIFSLLSGINMIGTEIMILLFFYYSFAYKRLYKLTFGQLLLKILKFIGILLLFMIPLLIITVISIVINK